MVKPNKPVAHVPDTFDAAEDATLEWDYSHPSGDAQTDYQVIVEEVGVAAVYNSGKTTSSVDSHVVPGGSLTNGVLYKWYVTVWQGSDLAASDRIAFTPRPRPVATITYPAASDTVEFGDFQVAWSFSQDDGGVQTKYRVRLLDGTTVVYDSGWLNGDDDHHDVTGIPDGSYTVEVQVEGSWPILSEKDTVAFDVLTVPPMTPTFTVDAATGPYGVVQVTNPTPTGGEPEAESNQLFRRVQGESDWTRVATGLDVDGEYLDWGLGGGQPYEFFVRTYSVTGSFADSTLVTATLPLWGVWLHSCHDPAGTFRQYLYLGGERTETVGAATELMQYAGRSHPVAEFGEAETRAMAAGVLIPFGASHAEDLRRLREFVRSRAVVAYRDGRGRAIFGAIGDISLQDRPEGTAATFTIQRVDYTEAV